MAMAGGRPDGHAESDSRQDDQGEQTSGDHRLRVGLRLERGVTAKQAAKHGITPVVLA